MGHVLHRLPGHHTVPDARQQGVTTEGVSAIRRREERPQARQQAGPYGGSGLTFPFDVVEHLNMFSMGVIRTFRFCPAKERL